MFFLHKSPSLSVTTALAFISFYWRELSANAALFSSPPPAYSDWLNHRGRDYDHQAFIGTDDEVVIHWRIDANTFFMAAAVEADGWLGFGIASAGGMPGSDIITYTSKNNQLQDSYALVDGMPLPDNCQDWTLHHSIADSGFMLFEASRPLFTGDTQDHDISDDSEISQPSHRVIAARGDSDQVAYHFDNRATGFIRFFPSLTNETSNNDVVEGDSASEDAGTLELRADHFLIPGVETTYHNFCFSYEDLLGRGLPKNSTVHMTGADFINDPNTAELVHHLIVFAADDEDAACEEAFKILYLWAPGAEPFRLPEEAGFALGEAGFKKLRMEIHYDNRDGATDKIDNSGAKLHFTTLLRQHEAGVFSIGEATEFLYGEEVGRGYTQYDFVCPGSCTQNHFTGSVTVFLELLHMHQTGARMVNRHYRGEEVVHEGSVDYYDFEATGAFTVLQKPFELAPGDAIHTTCYYQEGGKTKFGPSSKDEMCIGFLLYYPRVDNFYEFCGVGAVNLTQDLSCEGSFTKTTLASESEMGRRFGVGSDVCAGDTLVQPSPKTLVDSAGVRSAVSWVGSAAVVVLATIMLFQFR